MHHQLCTRSYTDSSVQLYNYMYATIGLYVKLSQVARECPQARQQVPRDQSNDSDLMEKVWFADEFEWKTVKSKRESKLDRLAKG